MLNGRSILGIQVWKAQYPVPCRYQAALLCPVSLAAHWQKRHGQENFAAEICTAARCSRGHGIATQVQLSRLAELHALHNRPSVVAARSCRVISPSSSYELVRFLAVRNLDALGAFAILSWSRMPWQSSFWDSGQHKYSWKSRTDMHVCIRILYLHAIRLYGCSHQTAVKPHSLPQLVSGGLNAPQDRSASVADPPMDRRRSSAQHGDPSICRVESGRTRL